MRKDLDHLPQKKQRELARAVDILFAEFEDVLKLATSPRKKSGRILKIILFGSYARGGWVDEPHTSKGYMSDYDLLVIVNHKDLTDLATYWHTADDRLMRDPEIKTPVNFIVHTMDEVNNALAQGQYFFSDIKREGIVLYELPGYPLIEPKLITAEEAYKTAKGHFERWYANAMSAIDFYRFGIREEKWNDAAFMLHQATERLYQCLLLTVTNYGPSTHNIKFLRSLAEANEKNLINAWPRETKNERRCFELLKRAYVDARYSEHYAVTKEELNWLGIHVDLLQHIVEQVCKKKLHNLKEFIS
ncbi:nucleotidyltransferase and HEPN domain-containing protein [Govanella unica]|uniref:Nucleotidyltransferase and HEPN domain-containing protein n=1 Tax=Govanella unica TaxID=2975056 RepID=A0A9X3TXC4_9PROT|nr:nucleotidyltransferase and HEPN domain-containing protein [Govania unica]MDA5193701.1 nucleotidyltransferase and HEPN domain-containing protein [Govania unica]